MDAFSFSETPPTILVVEGRSLSKLGIAHRLQESGYLTLETEEPEEALDFLSGWDISLVMVDTDMKDGMDGESLSRRVSEHWPQIPLVACYDAQRVPASVTGSIRYLRRPYDEHTLLHTVSAFCPLSGESGNAARSSSA